MNQIIRYYNQNRRKIWSIIIVIGFGFFLLYYINYLTANPIHTISSNGNTTQSTNTTNNIKTNSAISGGSQKNSRNKETNLIEEFIKYCNQGKTTEAYNLLSKDCKEIMYPTIELFIENYYNRNFEKNQTYEIQRWTGSIYKVDLFTNLLQTGSKQDANKQDFMSIVNENNEKKLNINNYIGREILNKQANLNNVYIKVACKDTYMDYEVYTFEIENKSDKEVYLDNLEKTSTIYVRDENDIKHKAYTHEITKPQLHLNKYSKNKMQIKFSNSYVNGRDIAYIVFENIIIDNKSNNKISIKIK